MRFIRVMAGLVSIGFLGAAVASEVPVTAGLLMQGFPADKNAQVTSRNFMEPPYSRWGFQHIRELQPTREVYKGTLPSSRLESATLDLESLNFDLAGGRQVDLTTWMEEASTDAFVVLHQGKVVYEKYLNGMQAHSQHQMFSATKSFVSTLTLLLIEEGLIEPDRLVRSYLPELSDSAFGNATVQQVLDMTVSLKFNEDYTDRDADIWKYGYVFSISGKAPEEYSGATTIYDYLPTLNKGKLEHGNAFHYVTPNTDVLAWLNSRVSGKSLSSLISERFWQRLGVERDGYIWLEGNGVEMAGGGLNVTARDAARFGQMVLAGGRYNNQQIIPESVASRILKSGNPDTFSRFHKDPWYTDVGYAYHDMWWTFNNPHKAVSAIGVYGQFIYIDPVAEMVVVKQSSHPEAEGVANEVDGPQIWQQIAEHLLSLK